MIFRWTLSETLTIRSIYDIIYVHAQIDIIIMLRGRSSPTFIGSSEKKTNNFCTYVNLESMAQVSSLQAYIAFNFSLYKNFEMKFPFERYISGLD